MWWDVQICISIEILLSEITYRTIILIFIKHSWNGNLSPEKLAPYAHIYIYTSQISLSHILTCKYNYNLLSNLFNWLYSKPLFRQLTDVLPKVSIQLMIYVFALFHHNNIIIYHIPIYFGRQRTNGLIITNEWINKLATIDAFTFNLY